jgi:hypothetical protein
MDNRRMGSQGSSLALDQRFGTLAVEVARAVNHAVIATEWVARVILLLSALLVLYYAADRVPPFAVTSSAHAEARAGDYVTIHANVYRDTTRTCNADFSRYIYDSSGARFDLGHSQASAEAIAQMERRSPGSLTIAFRIPPSVAPGPASLQTVLRYRCNRVHHLIPIEVTTDMPFTVLP